MYNLSKYSIITENENKLLLYSTLSRELLTLPLSYREFLKPFKSEEFSNSEIEHLLLKQFLYTDKEFDVLQEYKEHQLKIESDVYEIQITPSANCQLGCDYCGQSHTNERFEEALDDKLIAYIEKKIKTTKCKTLIVQWYGGEPLTSIYAIERLSNKIIELCQNNGIGYTSNIVTNGLLLSLRNFQKLLDLKIVEYQITIDGDKEEHDNRRFFKNKKGSFDKIYNNVKAICENKFVTELEYNLNIRCNIDKRNALALWRLMDLFEKDKIQDKINLYIKAVHNWENDASLLCLSVDEFAKFEIDFLSRKILKNYKNYTALLPPRMYTTCMATSNGTMELIDIKGNIFNCNEMPFIERLEKFALGNIKSEEIKKDKYGLDNWFEKVEKREHSNCIDCSLLPVCGGYCPKHWIDGNKNVCPSIKHNIKEVIELKYLISQKD